MRRRIWLNLLIIGVGILLQSIYWLTDIFFVGLLGHIAFISGLVMFPTTVTKKKKEDDKSQEDTRNGDSNA